MDEQPLAVDESQPVISPMQTLEEFCCEISTGSKRVELINAFAYVESAAGRLRDTEANYQARFDAFVGQPVK